MDRLQNKTEILILQHPQEKKEALASVPLIVESLERCTLRVGLSWSNLSAALGRTADPKKWLVLYFGGGLRDFGGGLRGEKQLNIPILQPVNRKGEPLLTEGGWSREIQGILVLDGTWSQAKALWWRNAWLLKLRRAVLTPPQRSLYGKSRREPKKECVSTIEALAWALGELGEGSVRDFLIQKFSGQVMTHTNKKPAKTTTD